MSTYYYLACRDHKVYCDAASRTGSGGIVALCDSDRLLSPFCYRHHGCCLVVIDENDLDYDEYEAYQEVTVSDLPILGGKTYVIFDSS